MAEWFRSAISRVPRRLGAQVLEHRLSLMRETQETKNPTHHYDVNPKHVISRFGD